MHPALRLAFEGRLKQKGGKVLLGKWKGKLDLKKKLSQKMLGKFTRMIFFSVSAPGQQGP